MPVSFLSLPCAPVEVGSGRKPGVLMLAFYPLELRNSGHPEGWGIVSLGMGLVLWVAGIVVKKETNAMMIYVLAVGIRMGLLLGYAFSQILQDNARAREDMSVHPTPSRATSR